MGTTSDPGFILCIYRHTKDVSAMVAFLQALGLHRTVPRDQDGCTFVWGRRGMIALFDERSGEVPAQAGGAQLCFETPDRDAAAAKLSAAGLKVVSWDEPPAPACGVQDPQGAGVWVSEAYHDPDDGADYEPHPIDVVAVRDSADLATDEKFFAEFGFLPEARQASSSTLVGPGDAGVLRLRGRSAQGGVPAGQASEVGHPALVSLAFESNQDLGPVAARLRDARFEVSRLEGDQQAFATTDPDGVRVEVHRV